MPSAHLTHLLSKKIDVDSMIENISLSDLTNRGNNILNTT